MKTKIFRLFLSNDYSKLCLYTYSDDIKNFYISNFHSDIKRSGYGKKLLIFTENLAYYFNAKQIFLLVKINSRVHDWYIRCGYVNYSKYKNDNTYIWMKKILK